MSPISHGLLILRSLSRNIFNQGYPTTKIDRPWTPVISESLNKKWRVATMKENIGVSTLYKKDATVRNLLARLAKKL